MKRHLLILVFFSLLVLAFVTQCSPAPAQPPAAPQPPAAVSPTQPPAASSPTQPPAAAAPTTANAVPAALDGKTLVETRCTVCHSMGRIQSAHHDQAAWKVTTDRMIGKGAQVNADEQAAIIKYLAETYK